MGTPTYCNRVEIGLSEKQAKIQFIQIKATCYESLEYLNKMNEMYNKQSQNLLSPSLPHPETKDWAPSNSISLSGRQMGNIVDWYATSGVRSFNNAISFCCVWILNCGWGKSWTRLSVHFSSTLAKSMPPMRTNRLSGWTLSIEITPKVSVH